MPPQAAEPVLLESIVTRGRVTRRDSHSAIVTSQALDWPGVRVEAGRNDVSSVDDLVGDQHYLSLNLDRVPLKLEVRESNGFKPFIVPPQSLWVSPSLTPITLRLRRTYAVRSAQIRHLMLTLRDEADSHNAGGLALVEAVTAGLGHLLQRHAGIEAPRPVRVRGGLAAAAKRRVLELIDAALDARLTIETLAGEADLSPAHFARAFKESLGTAPHQYLLARRLERARQLLETTGANLSDIAQRTGFADQAHFTRLFKRAFGTTPGALVRALH